jgi:hypothetical protein
MVYCLYAVFAWEAFYIFLFMYYKKSVSPDDDLLIKSKHIAPLNTYIPNCVDGYYVVINLKNNGISDLKIITIYSENHKKHTNIQFGKKEELLNCKVDGIYNLPLNFKGLNAPGLRNMSLSFCSTVAGV